MLSMRDKPSHDMYKCVEAKRTIHDRLGVLHCIVDQMIHFCIALHVPIGKYTVQVNLVLGTLLSS